MVFTKHSLKREKEECESDRDRRKEQKRRKTKTTDGLFFENDEKKGIDTPKKDKKMKKQVGFTLYSERGVREEKGKTSF